MVEDGHAHDAADKVEVVEVLRVDVGMRVDLLHREEVNK